MTCIHGVVAFFPNTETSSYVYFTSLSAVAPEIIDFSTGAPSRFVGEVITANCCAIGNPKPVITINEHLVQTSFQFTGVAYEGCALRNITTSDMPAGTNLTTTCHVTLSQVIICPEGNNNVSVPQKVLELCNVTLRNASSTRTNFVSGESQLNLVILPNHTGRTLFRELSQKQNKPQLLPVSQYSMIASK